MIPVVAFHKSLERHKKIVQKIFDIVKIKNPKNLIIVLKPSKKKKFQYTGSIWEHGDKPLPKRLQRFLPKYTYVIIIYLPKTRKKIRARLLPYLLAHEYRHWEQMNVMDEVPHYYERDAETWAMYRVFHAKNEELDKILDEYENI